MKIVIKSKTGSYAGEFHLGVKRPAFPTDSRDWKPVIEHLFDALEKLDSATIEITQPTEIGN